MGVPTLSKTWQLSANQTCSGASAAIAMGQLALTIKNALKGFANNPWTVSGSSNAGGTTGSPTGAGALDGTDRWSTQADINTGGSNSRHAWTVLRQTKIASTFEVCLDFNNTGTLSAITMAVSPSAGFTGGSATARPTATDEIVMLNQGSWCSGTPTQYQANIWQSTDGQCTRVVVWNGGTTLGTFFLFDVPQNPNPNWTKPSVFSVFSASSGIAMTYSSLSTSGLAPTWTWGLGASPMQINYTGESDHNGLLANTTSVGSVVNDIDSALPLFPIGLDSMSSGDRGRHGNLFDLWWTPNAVANGDSWPNNASTRQFIAFGPLVFPWTGDGTAALLT